jgi:hypothetical protein
VIQAYSVSSTTVIVICVWPGWHGPAYSFGLLVAAVAWAASVSSAIEMTLPIRIMPLSQQCGHITLNLNQELTYGAQGVLVPSHTFLILKSWRFRDLIRVQNLDFCRLRLDG